MRERFKTGQKVPSVRDQLFLAFIFRQIYLVERRENQSVDQMQIPLFISLDIAVQYDSNACKSFASFDWVITSDVMNLQVGSEFD